MNEEKSTLSHYDLLLAYAKIVESNNRYILFQRQSYFFIIYRNQKNQNTECYFLNEFKTISIVELRFIIDSSFLFQEKIKSNIVPELKPTSCDDEVVSNNANEVFSLIDIASVKEMDLELKKATAFNNAQFPVSNLLYHSKKKQLCITLTDQNSKLYDFVFFSKSSYSSFFNYANCFLESFSDDENEVAIVFNPYFMFTSESGFSTKFYCISSEFDLQFSNYLFNRILKLNIEQLKIRFLLNDETTQVRRMFKLFIDFFSLSSNEIIDINCLNEKWNLMFNLSLDQDIQPYLQFASTIQKKLRTQVENNSDYNELYFLSQQYQIQTIRSNTKKVFVTTGVYKKEAIEIILTELNIFLKTNLEIKLQWQ